jgi:D-amino-acid N-acetyltransferase
VSSSFFPKKKKKTYLARVSTIHLLRSSQFITTIKFSTTMSSPSIVQIRPIQDSDKETWKNLWGQYNVFYKRTIPDNVTEATFDRFLDPQNPISCAVATNGSQPIGFATYYPHPSTASIDPNFYLHDLFVDPSSRAAGTGEKLIDYVADKAREAGAYQLYWHTQVGHDRCLRLGYPH